ncbi:MAG: DALR domain-containing protein, partial [Actinomycetes bacterium]
KVRGIELRWYLGSAHYRSMLEFSFEALEESAVAFRRIEAFLDRSIGILGKTPEGIIASGFADAMNDDLAVPAALALLSETVKSGNNALASNNLVALEVAVAEVRGTLGVLGCDPLDEAFLGSQPSNTDAIDGLISLALQQREAARARKDFAASDAIRDQIAALGIVIEDTPQGPRWQMTSGR